MVIKKYITFHFKLWVVSHLPKVAESIVLVYFCCVVFTFATFLRLNFFLSFLLSCVCCCFFILLFFHKELYRSFRYKCKSRLFSKRTWKFLLSLFLHNCWLLVLLFKCMKAKVLYFLDYSEIVHIASFVFLLLCWDCFVATTKLKL